MKKHKSKGASPGMNSEKSTLRPSPRYLDASSLSNFKVFASGRYNIVEYNRMLKLVDKGCDIDTLIQLADAFLRFEIEPINTKRKRTGYSRGWIHRPIDPLPAVRIGAKILFNSSSEADGAGL